MKSLTNWIGQDSVVDLKENRSRLQANTTAALFGRCLAAPELDADHPLSF